MSIMIKNFRDEFVAITLTDSKILVDEVDETNIENIITLIEKRNVFNITEIKNISSDDSILNDVINTYAINDYVVIEVNSKTIKKIFLSPKEEDI